VRVRPSIARRALTLMCAGAMLAASVVGEAQAAVAAIPQGACNFRFGAISDSGAAGTVYYTVTLEPADPAQHCTTDVAFTVTATHGPSGTRYTSIDDNPLTAMQTVRFAPGRLLPTLTVAWGGFHCADPAVAGVLTFASAGQTASTGVTPGTCAGMGHSHFTFSAIPTLPSAVGIAPTLDNRGYRVLTDDGAVSHQGDATALAFPFPLVCPAFGCLVPGAIAIVTTPTGNGAWVSTPAGGVFEYGTAIAHGSLAGQALNAPIVGIAAAPDGHGYWLTASDGGVFAFGSAKFSGSLGGRHLNAPVVGIAAGPHTGYWLVGTDGSVFAYGGAPFIGSLGAKRLNAQVSAMAATSTGHGYWLLGADRGVFAFGDARFYGTPPIFVP